MDFKKKELQRFFPGFLRWIVQRADYQEQKKKSQYFYFEDSGGQKEVCNVLASLPSLDTTHSSKKTTRPPPVASEEPFADLQWPPSDEEFIIALEEQEWCVCSVISFDEASNTIKAHQLQPIKTRAKDDAGKTYWIYSEEENVDVFEEKHILALRPSISLAKNIKRKDPVFALLNREVIEGMTTQFYT